VKPARFEYHRASSVEAAIDLLETLGEDAKLIAGGQSLVPMMNFRLARPTALVDVARVPGLDTIAADGAGLRIGALVTHAALERTSDPAVLDGFGVLPRTARLIGHPPIRTRGTFGGSLAHADPAAEWCVLALVLDAEIVVAGPSGARTVAARDLFTGFLTTALEPSDMIVEVRFPGPAPRCSFAEHARRYGDFALVAAGVRLDLEEGVCRSARIAVGGVGPTPVRIDEAEALLGGQVPGPELHEEAARVVASSLDPISDVHAPGEHRRRLAQVLVRAALDEAGGTP
jgi:aerobic carbon-monoxide dehydrogenase medium subunit